MAAKKPNILIILTDQLRHPPSYESAEVGQFRRTTLAAEQGLRSSGISFECHYTMSTACTPSLSSLITGQYPSLHGVTRNDGLAPDSVPTIGDWFRAGGYRTFYKGKWHVSHAALPAADGDGYLQTLSQDGRTFPENILKYLEADLLDQYGFSEWVGPEAHGFGHQNTGTARDPFTADETIDLILRLDNDDSDKPWLSVCLFLNPHDISMSDSVAVSQGVKHDFTNVPEVSSSPTHNEDLSTKPTAQQSYVDAWSKILAPQPWEADHRKFYYQLLKSVDVQIARVLNVLKASNLYKDTIVLFSSDHGDMLGAHGGMHQKWHNAYEETIHIPLVVSSPLFKYPGREIEIPTSHADLLPTLLGLAGIDAAETLRKVSVSHKEARPLVGRDLSGLILGTKTLPADPIFFMTDDEIREGRAKPGSPFESLARKIGSHETVTQPNHIETVVAAVDIDGIPHLVKLSRYHDNPQFWAVPGERDERILRGNNIQTFTTPAPDEFELYDLTTDPMELVNLAHPSNEDDDSRKLYSRMFQILVEQLAAKRLVPTSGELPGYTAPALTVEV